MENEIDDVLTLLSLMVHADKRVFSKEIEVFLASAQSVFSSGYQVKQPSEAILLLWFERNRDDIAAKLNDPDFERWFTDLVTRVAQISYFDLIIDALRNIATADNELHVSEKALLVLTSVVKSRAKLAS